MYTFKELKERYGEDGLKELQLLDMRAADLIDRLYKLSCIALNLQALGVEGGDKWWNKQSAHLNRLMDESDAMVAEFQKMRGEL